MTGGQIYFKDFETNPSQIREECEDILYDGGTIVWVEEKDNNSTAVVTARYPVGSLVLLRTLEELASDAPSSSVGSLD